MISIRRGPSPAVLRNAPADEDWYNHDDVVQALWDMQHGNCCYCEQSIPEEGQGQHVEHFRPKSRSEFAHLRNKWSNLLLACPMCNGQKGDQFPVDQGQRAILIDPSSRRINPERHIGFVVDDGDDDPTGLPAALTPRGRKSIEVLGLWLSHFVRLRCRHFRQVVRPGFERLLEAKRDGNDEKRDTAKTDFEELLYAPSPFAGFVRCFARRKHLETFGIRIPVGAQSCPED